MAWRAGGPGWPQPSASASQPAAFGRPTLHLRPNPQPGLLAINRYGFYDECQRKYGNANGWRYCTEVFDFLTLAVSEGGLPGCACAHGRLLPAVPSGCRASCQRPTLGPSSGLRAPRETLPRMPCRPSSTAGCCACMPVCLRTSAPWTRSVSSTACARFRTKAPSATSCGPTRRILTPGPSHPVARVRGWWGFFLVQVGKKGCGQQSDGGTPSQHGREVEARGEQASLLRRWNLVGGLGPMQQQLG